MSEILSLTGIKNSKNSIDPMHLPMRTVVFTSQKGGSGKTTLCGQLAAQAHKAGFGPVALIDTDPQGSLSDWWNARGDDTLQFVQTSVDVLPDTIAELRAVGIKLVCVDTQPTVTPVIKSIVNVADLVVIPTRPSPHDLRAVGPTLDLVEECGKPIVFAVNSATRRARITGDAAVALSQHGTVAPVTIHNRTDFATSMINGRSVVESHPKSASAREIESLWTYLAERLSRLPSQHPLPLQTEPAELPDPEDVGNVMELLGFDEQTVADEVETVQRSIAARKSQPCFGRRGLAHAANA